MLLSKSVRIILLIVNAIFLLTLPLYNQIYYVTAYYVFASLFAILILIKEIFNYHDKSDERFYIRWGKARKRGKWVNFMLSGLRWLLYMILIVSIGQFFGRGLTPIDLASSLPRNTLPPIIAVLTVFSSISGGISWYENEKRYSQISWKKVKDK